MLGGWEQGHSAEERGGDSAPVSRGADNEENKRRKGNDSMPEAGRLLNMMNNSDGFLLKQSPCQHRKHFLSSCFHKNIMASKRQNKADIPLQQKLPDSVPFHPFFSPGRHHEKKIL
jgi:hypothetical protein